MAILMREKKCHSWHATPGFLFAACFCVFGMVMVATSARAADEPLASEYQVKAAFLINFPKYVEWPDNAFADKNSPVVIGMLGETRVTGELQKIITGRTVNGHGFVLKQLNSIEEVIGCHIVFIAADQQQHAPDFLAKLKNTSVLTVGESDDFLDNGGIVNLARRDHKIALEVNLAAAANARIKISSKLLSVASVVKGKSN
jgi:hypothetical protein